MKVTFFILHSSWVFTGKAEMGPELSAAFVSHLLKFLEMHLVLPASGYLGKILQIPLIVLITCIIFLHNMVPVFDTA